MLLVPKFSGRRNAVWNGPRCDLFTPSKEHSYLVTVSVIPNVWVIVPDVAVTVSCDVWLLGELVTPSAQPPSTLPAISMKTNNPTVA